MASGVVVANEAPRRRKLTHEEIQQGKKFYKIPVEKNVSIIRFFFF